MKRPCLLLTALLAVTVSCSDLPSDGAMPVGGSTRDDAGTPAPDGGGDPALIDMGTQPPGDVGVARDTRADSTAPDSSSPDAAAVVDAGDAGVDGGGPMPLRSSKFAMADPDTVLAKDGKYITYGTTVPAGRGERCGGRGKLYVPYLEHGGGNVVGISDCAAGDAMPDGPGAWAEPGGAIWAPGVARFGNRYFMYYTASRRGSQQKCIGRAVSNSARGPFVSRGEWACPPAGRWAIDANPIVVGQTMYVAYRDDAITTFPDTGLSIVRTDDEGRAQWGSRVDLLVSTDIDWESIRMSGTTRVIENPTMFRAGGEWYVAYAGNNWDSRRYATGIASCGPDILPSTRCRPIRRGKARPYFGFRGNGDLDPYRELPLNKHGSGALDVFEAADGSYRAVWHWWSPSERRRYPVIGRFARNNGGFYVEDER